MHPITRPMFGAFIALGILSIGLALWVRAYDFLSPHAFLFAVLGLAAICYAAWRVVSHGRPE